MTSIRKLKARAYALRNTQLWDTAMEKMYFIRGIKPCHRYSPWCSDCNGNLFRTTLGRFPHSVEEFNMFENSVQARTKETA